MKKATYLYLLLLLGVATYAQAVENSTRVAENQTYDLQWKNEKMKSELSTIWTTVLLNMITADVLSLYVPESMERFTDFADGREADLMLAGAIYYQIPISMVYFSKVLPYKVNRWTNMITAGLVAVAVTTGGSTDPYYMVFAGAELIGLSLIAWKAWNWREPENEPKEDRHGLNLNLNHQRQSYGLSYGYRF